MVSKGLNAFWTFLHAAESEIWPLIFSRNLILAKISENKVLTVQYIPDRDSRVMDEVGFRIPRVGFRIPGTGFRIPKAKIFWIPDSGFSYMGQSLGRRHHSVGPRYLIECFPYVTVLKRGITKSEFLRLVPLLIPMITLAQIMCSPNNFCQQNTYNTYKTKP